LRTPGHRAQAYFTDFYAAFAKLVIFHLVALLFIGERR
jgi:hypothetical protein